MLKPTQTGLDTTMTIGTDKRPYYVRLVSTGHDHMARVAFSYPAEEQEAKPENAAAAELHQAEESKKQEQEVHLASLNTDKPLRNWSYRVKMHGKDSAYLRPEKIGDDGTHTHIVLSEEARHRGLPVVQLQDARGPIPANARWAGNELIVDAVFDHACLLSGVGPGAAKSLHYQRRIARRSRCPPLNLAGRKPLVISAVSGKVIWVFAGLGVIVLVTVHSGVPLPDSNPASPQGCAANAGCGSRCRDQ